MIIPYSQRDKRWASKKLGISGLDMAGYGCLVTATIFQINREINTSTNPGEYCDWLNKNKLFTPQGQMYWSAVDKFTRGRLRYLGNQWSLFARLRKKYTLSQVYFGRINHWVALLPGGKCLDPWTGKIMNQSDWKFTGQKRYLG